MLDIVCFKWRQPRYRSAFGPTTVNILKRMIDRHYAQPHRVTCVTDDAKGIDPSVRIVPSWNEFANVPSPYGPHQPSCYRRLKLFAAEAATLIGPRFVCLDLDTVITGDLTPLWDRPEDFVMWGETDPRSHYNGSMFLMTAGARRQVWDTFDPDRSPQQAKAQGFFGSDQGHVSRVLGPGEAMWTTTDGVYSYNVHLKKNGGALPANAAVVFFHGSQDPWGPEAQRLAWVKAHYH